MPRGIDLRLSRHSIIRFSNDRSLDFNFFTSFFSLSTANLIFSFHFRFSFRSSFNIFLKIR